MKKKTIWISSAVAAALVLGGTGVAVAATDPFDSDDEQLTGTTLEQASEAALDEVGEGKVTESEAEDGGYEITITRDDGTTVVVDLDSAFEVVRVDEQGDDDDDENGDDSADDNTPLTDDEKLKATEAALAEAPGTVAGIERSDDADTAFEVDVTREDGTMVEIELDENFAVVRVDDHADDNRDDSDSDDNSGSDNSGSGSNDSGSGSNNSGSGSDDR